MNHLTFSPLKRVLALLAGIVNLLVGLGFFFLPELQFPLWPTSIPAILDRFIAHYHRQWCWRSLALHRKGMGAPRVLRRHQ